MSMFDLFVCMLMFNLFVCLYATVLFVYIYSVSAYPILCVLFVLVVPRSISFVAHFVHIQ